MNYDEALAAFLAALEVDTDTVFEVVATEDKATIKHVSYEELPNGTMSGKFWNEVIERGESE